MSRLLAIGQRVVNVSRLTRLPSTQAVIGFWKQAPYVTVGGVAGFVAALVVSIVFTGRFPHDGGSVRPK
jgi:hypothetical protein